MIPTDMEARGSMYGTFFVKFSGARLCVYAGARS